MILLLCLSSCQKLSNAATHVCSFIYLFKLCHLLKEVLLYLGVFNTLLKNEKVNLLYVFMY
jgi:hypothetical protein